MSSLTEIPRRRIVPDYRRPQALLVPHYYSTVTATLENIAEQASRYVGVILLAQDPDAARAFVNTQPDPELFHILTAPFDTPWLRDRSPVAVRQSKQIHWILPHLDTPERPLDQQLFHSITRRPLETTTFGLPHGNLVAGPDGRALVLLRDDDDSRHWQENLASIAPLLGVTRWILAHGFEREITGHADTHARFLGRRLAAVAWNEDVGDDQRRCEYLEQQIKQALPGITILRLPLRSDGDQYASPLNWLQLGRHLLVPRYPLTPAKDIKVIRQRLEDAGFRPRFIYSPTLEYAGSLHCLTANIYL